jgi:hypothetical protein
MDLEDVVDDLSEENLPQYAIVEISQLKKTATAV